MVAHAEAPERRATAGQTPDLERSARNIRRLSLQMGAVQGQGYVGQALGWADVLAVAYCHAMNVDPKNPRWEGRDRFLLSHGHYAIGHYAALMEAGLVPVEELETYGGDGSRLPMSGMTHYTPGMEMSGGSLGLGLSIAVGMALGLRAKRNPACVYNSMSDGELNEGSTWEAALAASHHRLSNLICLVDINDQQADGKCSAVLSLAPLDAKWRAFGWQVQTASHQMPIAELAAVFDRARAPGFDGPRVILYESLMGKGVSFLEARERNHFLRVDEAEWQRAIDEIDMREKEPGR